MAGRLALKAACRVGGRRAFFRARVVGRSLRKLGDRLPPFVFLKVVGFLVSSASQRFVSDGNRACSNRFDGVAGTTREGHIFHRTPGIVRSVRRLGVRARFDAFEHR